MSNPHLFEKINVARVGSGEIKTLDIVLIDPEDVMICLEWTAPDGFVSADAPSQPVSLEDDDMFVYGIIHDKNIGYMFFKHLNPQSSAQFARHFEQAVLSLMDTEGLIIDLRGTSGGEYPTYLFRGLAHLVQGTEDRQFYSLAVRDPGSDDRRKLADAIEGWGSGCAHARSDARFELGGLCRKAIGSSRMISSNPLRADEPDLFYSNPIVVLVGPKCLSACDHLVHLLSQFPEITTIGRDPNGSLTFPLKRM